MLETVRCSCFDLPCVFVRWLALLWFGGGRGLSVAETKAAGAFCGQDSVWNACARWFYSSRAQSAGEVTPRARSGETPALDDWVSLLMPPSWAAAVRWRVKMFFFSAVGILIEDKWFLFPNSCCCSTCLFILPSFWQRWKARQQSWSRAAFGVGLGEARCRRAGEGLAWLRLIPEIPARCSVPGPALWCPYRLSVPYCRGRGVAEAGGDLAK